VKLKPVELLHVFYEPEHGKRTRVGRLAARRREILFEYDAQFLTMGLEISPFKLPLRSGLVVGDPAIFQGLMGVFDDSLPDGWGRRLLDRRIAKEGLRPEVLGPLDRLAWVGTRGMGALVYEPELGLEAPTIVNLAEIAKDTEAVLEDIEGPDLDRLIAIGGSPQGARPKALVQIGPDKKTILYGAAEIRPGFASYLVKFRGKGDDVYAGLLEHVYTKMAALCGLTVTETRMLGRTKRHPGYFAVQRFDRAGTRKLHIHTFCGLMHAPHDYPSLTYRELLLATRALTRDESAVEEMFRRACFNVFAHNRDDHTKNFAFVMDEEGAWTVSPAYDLTFSHGPGGEHTLLVGTEGKNPTRRHLEALAKDVGIKRANRILDEVRAGIDHFRAIADEADLPKKIQDVVAKALGPQAPRASSAKRRGPPKRSTRTRAIARKGTKHR
jgi:serine/threonine-protein kinase HipA